MENNIPGVRRKVPRQSVTIQLNTFIAEGSAIKMVNTMKIVPRVGFSPVTNIWCAHTTNDNMVIAIRDITIAL